MKIKTQVINEEIKTENNKNSLLSSLESKRDNESQNKKLKYHLDKMNYLMSVDISLSKPIFVRKSYHKNNKIKNDEKKFDKIDEVIKQKKSDEFSYNNNALNQSINSDISDNKNSYDEDSINNDKKNKFICSVS